MSYLRLVGVEKHFGQHAVIKGVDLVAEQGEFVVFVGPSGCGKSTLLRMIAGLEEVSSGDIFIDDARVTELEPAKRQVAMVFQSYALFPHMSVRENIAFGMRMAKMPKPDIETRVAEAARILQMESLLDRKPRELSGGQRQRVAIGRAIVRHPKLFLFDEPLSNLDAELRTQMRVEIAKLHNELGVTMVYVTHDQVEAMTLADRIVVLRAGRVEQIGTPQQLYDSPDNRFVAGFMGAPKMNFLEAVVEGAHRDTITLAHAALDIPITVSRRHLHRAGPQRGAPVTIGLRPEHLTIAGAGIGLAVDLLESLGGSTLVHGRTASGETIVLQVPGRPALRVGDGFAAGFDPDAAYLFDKDGRAL